MSKGPQEQKFSDMNTGYVGNKKFVDPKLKALLSQECHSNLKLFTFDERVERMFTKIKTNAIRHKSNFKSVEYELDAQVTQFMKERKKRLNEQTVRESMQRQGVKPYPERGALEDPAEDRARKNAEEREINEGRLRALLERLEVQQANYDPDCIDLCIPYAEVLPKDVYKELVQDEDKVS